MVDLHGEVCTALLWLFVSDKLAQKLQLFKNSCRCFKVIVNEFVVLEMFLVKQF